MPTALLDSSVVVALLSPTDRLHGPAQSAVADLELAGMAFAVPTVVYAEVLVGALRRGGDGVEALDRFLDAAIDRVVDLSRSVATAAAGLRANDLALRLPDAIVIATGQVLDALVLTADRRWTRYGERVRVIG